ncbi:hypothetical protein [Streptomyces sp. Inha503]|uniref:hypothetical protein n=1 Tax=Streptomyces sp. Inha503 TaxID=3383314 RepID=UPI0039A3484F
MIAEHRKAALVVADHSRDAADCRQLLEALGLAEPAPKRRGRPRGEYGHGIPARYSQGCRCKECTAAFTASAREWRARVRQDPSAADRAGHGKASTYKNYACRCSPCVAANTDRCRAQRAARKARAA